ncbi:hypothetical protein J6590_088370, partial [Homalodisca vitripennis]
MLYYLPPHQVMKSSPDYISGRTIAKYLYGTLERECGCSKDTEERHGRECKIVERIIWGEFNQEQKLVPSKKILTISLAGREHKIVERIIW